MAMSRDRLFHILCTDGEKIRYEGRFQMSSRKEAYRFLRDKIGRKNLYGLHFTITEFPIDVLREVVEAIIRKKPIPEGDIVHPIPLQCPPKNPNAKYTMIKDSRRDPNKPTLGNLKRRLGDL